MAIFILCLLLFINAMSIGLVFPIFAPLFLNADGILFSVSASLHQKALFYNLILAVPPLFMVFGAPLLARLSDHIGRKKILIFSIIGIALSFLFSAIGIMASSLVLLFISRALAGFMDGSEAIAQACIADISIPAKKAHNMSYATFAGTIGFIIGPIIGGFLAEPALTGQFHNEIPFFISFGLTVLNGWLLYKFFPRHKLTLNKTLSINYLKVLSAGFKIAFDRRIRRYSLLLLIVQWCLAAFYQLSILFLVEKYHYSSGKVGLFTMFLGICFSGGIFFVIYALLSRCTHVNLLKMGLYFIVLALIAALSLQHSVLLPWVTVIPMMLGIAMMYNVLLVFISNSVSTNEQGDAMGSGTSLKALGWLSSSIIVASLYPHLNILLLMMLFVVGIGLILTRNISKLDT